MSEEPQKSTRRQAGRKKDGDTTYTEYSGAEFQYLNKIVEIEDLKEKEKQMIKLVVVNKFKYKEAGMAVGLVEKSASGYVSRIINTLGGKKYVNYLYQLQFEAEDELVVQWKKHTTQIAFTDRTQIIEKITQQNLFFVKFAEWPEDVKACVKGVKKTKDGGIEVLFESKIQALESLGKHLGVYLRDNMQKPEESVKIYLPENNRAINEG